jgi:hypothetical protein
VPRLCTEFELISFKDDERINKFRMIISNLASTLRSFGDIVDDEKIVRKFLSVVPTHFVHVGFSIETVLDPATMNIEEVLGHLRAVEERLEGKKGATEGQLLLRGKKKAGPQQRLWKRRKRRRP